MKKLTLSLRKSGGRNAYGRICSFHIGGGHKRRYRLVDFHRKDNLPVIVRTIEHDPNRSALVSLVVSIAGSLSFILTPQEVRLGDVLICNNRNAIMAGASMKLLDIPLGYNIHCVANKNENHILARAAGCYAQILKKTNQFCLLKLPSHQHVKVSINNTATIGKISNPQHYYKVIRKAGRTRWYGKTPVVRGVAMNPVDHPMGGKTHGKLHKTPWGKLAKGIKTRRN